MINANELRIGNIVAIKDQEKYIIGEPNEYAVTDIGDRVGLANRGKQQWGIEEIKPIKLNEEWLLKFGFADTNTGGYEIKIEDSICIRIFGTNVTILDKFWESVEIDIELHYVHKLQNLYYALTGEELTIK